VRFVDVDETTVGAVGLIFVKYEGMRIFASSFKTTSVGCDR